MHGPHPAQIAVGAVSGVLSGLFGIGGGIVTTPAIRLLLGFPALVAVGTPLLVILPTTLSGAWSYGRHGLVDLRSGIVTGLWGVPAAIVGAVATKYVGGTVVLLLTAALITWVALDMIVRAVRRGPDPRPAAFEGEEPVALLEDDAAPEAAGAGETVPDARRRSRTSSNRSGGSRSLVF